MNFGTADPAPEAGTAPKPDGPRPRWLVPAALALTLVQAGLTGAAITRNWGRWLQGDNFLYEYPAWNLASGHGMSIKTTEWEDPYLTDHYRARHPEAGDSPYIPAATFPPGYAWFLAGVYSLVGRSHLAAVVANGLLLAATVPLFSLLAVRAFGRTREVGVFLLLVASYPMWAYWAALVMSDTLHIFLITLFSYLWFVDTPTPWRSAAAGVVLGLASMVRPYSALLPVAFGLWYFVSRVPAFAPRQVVALTLAAGAVFGLWTARNFDRFGVLIPATSGGLGNAVWVAATFTFSRDVHSPPSLEEISAEQRATGIGDIHRHDENLKAMRTGIETIKKHPYRYLRDCLLRLPRRWITMTSSRDAMPAGLAVPFVAYQIALLVIMAAGVVMLWGTRNVVLAGSLVMVLYYTFAFSPLHVEARYMLPARVYGFLLSAPVIALALPGASGPGPCGAAGRRGRGHGGRRGAGAGPCGA